MEETTTDCVLLLSCGVGKHSLCTTNAPVTVTRVRCIQSETSLMLRYDDSLRREDIDPQAVCSHPETSHGRQHWVL
jgi:hypothetical protein